MHTVLYVEVNPYDAELMTLAVSQAKARFRLTIQSTGYDAIDYLRNKPRPDLVLLDYLFDSFHGTDLLSWIRKTPELHALPVVMLSGLPEDHIVAKCYAMAANYFIAKPRLLQQRLRLVKCIDACLQVVPPALEKLVEVAESPHLSRQCLTNQLRTARAQHRAEAKKQKALRLRIDLLLAESKELKKRFPFHPKNRIKP